MVNDDLCNWLVHQKALRYISLLDDGGPGVSMDSERLKAKMHTLSNLQLISRHPKNTAA